VTLLRHLAAILALPFVVVVWVPHAILGAPHGAEPGWPPGSVAAWAARAVGIALGLAGFALFARCVALFARVGRGTLAPWDPTRRLVVVGPYRFVRNPMISGVLAMLLAESLVLGSARLLAWAAGFWLLNHVYFQLSEEPGLRRRFGDDYARYCAAVPRWIPRRTAWEPDAAPL
jgi:protein-S-isoprenylcysteine O-methyltransferase Ste14